MRWHYRDPMLVWLLPASYAVHILEEWFGGFPEWVAAIAGGVLSREVFVAINTIAMMLMIAAARAAIRREENGWMAVAIATVLLVNAFLHLAGTLLTRSYSPGLVSSIILYAPLCQLLILRARTQATASAVRRGVATGLAMHAVVVLIAFSFVHR